MKNYLTVGDNVRLYVERYGRGEPLMLVAGLGAGTWLWRKNAAELSKHFELIIPELRGSGRSDKPDQRYSIALFAEDIKTVLEELNISRTHMLGVSMGGFVAQYFAATWPEKVQSLILAATTIGGDEQVEPDGNTLSGLIRPRGKTRQERLEYAYKFSFSPEYMKCHPQELARITNWRIEHPQPEFAYYRQLLAGNAYDGSELVTKISAPTLVCMSKDDALVPVENGEILRKRIPNARLVLFEGRHLFFMEHCLKFNQTIIEFLRSNVYR